MPVTQERTDRHEESIKVTFFAISLRIPINILLLKIDPFCNKPQKLSYYDTCCYESLHGRVQLALNNFYFKAEALTN